MKEVILIVVAHPDDETIGMGGSIKKHINKGDDVCVISMTDGIGSRDFSSSKEVKLRSESAKLASRLLGFKWGKSYDFADNKLDSYPILEIIKCVEKAKTKYNPTIVYTHSNADLNIDHRVITNAVLTAFRPQPNENCREIRLFEVPSATDYGNNIFGFFTPNLFISLEKEHWEAKLSALKAYKNEIREYPHSRSLESIQNLAKLRGNQIGVEMAECFQIVRKIDH